MNNNRTKTHRKTNGSSTDLSGSAFATNLAATTNTFVNFLNDEANGAYRRPWHRLERGLRINRLKKFADEEGAKLSLSTEDIANLNALLLKAHNDKKILNSKTSVIYDVAEEKIKEIKGLVMHRGADGKVLFQVLEKKNAVTFRRKQSTPAAPSGTSDLSVSGTVNLKGPSSE
jgi:hypothetical protein